jgi:farnesyl-diphosphate farnesyltransferase
MNDAIADLLQKTSRTFALTIPLLPEPTRGEVGIAYLLFRIIDTFEDATRWTPARRIEVLQRFAGLLDSPPAAGAELAATCGREPPVDHDGYRELLRKIPLVLEEFQRLRPEARAPIRLHLDRSAHGMAEFVARSDAPGGLELTTMEDLRRYCYAVAGIVGEMLTELFLLGSPSLAPVADDLRSRAAEFGEGLQLVNILKDVKPDAAERRVYLPSGKHSNEVFALAHADLDAAATYTETLHSAGADTGVVAFNTFIVRLAVASLQALRDKGPGAKLTRLQVAKIGAEVSRAVGGKAPLFARVGSRLAS